jgi:hypothetical protein
MLKQVKLDYDFSVFLNASYDQHAGSCIKHQVHELTDIHQEYGGFPETYRYENTLIHQLWWNQDQIDFIEIGSQLGMEVITISSILQPPGCVIPWHRDTFYQINKKYPERTEVKVRANIFLEDWKMGHFLQYDNTVATHWKSGEGLLWDSKVLHLGANAGMENKYTLQISGYLQLKNI